jgi:hypothetical protein
MASARAASSAFELTTDWIAFGPRPTRNRACHRAGPRLIGFIQNAPADMAERHDPYFYGRPRE